MMIAKDTQFSAVKALVHWYLLACAGVCVAGAMFLALIEFFPLAEFIERHDDVFSAAFAIAGLAWVVWTAWYIGHRDGYTKRVKPIPHGSLVTYYGERTLDVIGVVAVATLAGGAAAGCCWDDDRHPYDK